MLAIIMRNSILIYFILGIVLSSCIGEKVKDHYRIVRAEIQIGSYREGPNSACTDFSETTITDSTETIGIIIHMEREYYSDENSPTGGIMYDPEGWKGCNETITKFSISEQPEGKSLYVVGDTSKNGYLPKTLNRVGCQRLAENCDCAAGLSFENIQDFITTFNSQQEVEYGNVFLGPKHENESLIFFIDRSQLQDTANTVFYLSIEFSDNKAISTSSNELTMK